MTDKAISDLPLFTAAQLLGGYSVPVQAGSVTGQFTLTSLATFLGTSALVPASRLINTTTPLAGGGSLSADLTLSLINSGVTAATYGNATNVGAFTVSAKGLITAAANVPITGPFPPSGAAGGDLTGTYPNPTVDVLKITTGKLANNAVDNTKFRQGVALSVVGVTGNALANVADIAGTADQVLRVNGAGTALAFGQVASAGIVNNAVGNAQLRQGVARSVVGVTGNALANVGDIQGTADQVLVVNTAGTALAFGQVATAGIVTNAVDNTKFRQGVARSVVGVAGNATANVADIQGAADQVLVVNGAGTALAFGTVATAGITNAAVTYAKIQNVTAARLLGNPTGGAAAPSEISLGTGLSFAGAVLNAALTLAEANGFMNLIVNGGQEVWQRGAGGAASFAVPASTTQYCSDRWYVITNANQASVVSQQAGLTTQSQWCARVLRNAAQTGTGVMRYALPFDTDEIYRMRGKTLTLQVYARAGANWSPASGTLSYNLYCGTGAVGKRGASAFTGETNPLTGSVNLTPGAAATQTTATSSAIAANITQAEIQFSWTPVGSAGAADNVDLDEIGLEIGTVASSFDAMRLPFMVELMQGQRHYWKSFLYATAPAQNVGINTSEISWFGVNALTRFGRDVTNPVLMRSATTVTLLNPAATNAQARDETAGADCTGTSVITASTERGFTLVATQTAAGAQGGLIGVHATVEAGI